MKYKDYKHLIICISIISLWIMILFFLENIVSSKIDILNLLHTSIQVFSFLVYSLNNSISNSSIILPPITKKVDKLTMSLST